MHFHDRGRAVLSQFFRTVTHSHLFSIRVVQQFAAISATAELLFISRVFSTPRLSARYRACERSMSGAVNGAERAENRVERSGAVSGSCRKTMEQSGAGPERGAGRGLQK